MYYIICDAEGNQIADISNNTIIIKRYEHKKYGSIIAVHKSKFDHFFGSDSVGYSENTSHENSVLLNGHSE